MDIAYCVNKKMIEPLLVSSASLVRAAANNPLNIWIFHTDLGGHEIAVVRSMLEGREANVKVNVISFDGDRLGNWKGLHGEIVPFVKIFIAESVSPEVERILYLDADVIVLSGILNLFNIDMDGNVVAAVSHETVNRSYARSLYLGEGFGGGDRIFNSGVMLIDVSRWKNGGISDRLVRFVDTNHNRYDGADQVPMNVILRNRVMFLPVRYNKRVSPGKRFDPGNLKEGIIHFVGIPKPWDLGGKLNVNYGIYESFRDKYGIRPNSVMWHLNNHNFIRIAKGVKSGLVARFKNRV
ncbi:hypothetical protein AWN76_015550 [Rhodothermaceae bacterium RA]|nr:hypothetical protein AWN76_015550 [Rhodothermaceae bacterium RA]